MSLYNTDLRKGIQYMHTVPQVNWRLLQKEAVHVGFACAMAARSAMRWVSSKLVQSLSLLLAWWKRVISAFPSPGAVSRDGGVVRMQPHGLVNWATVLKVCQSPEKKKN